MRYLILLLIAVPLFAQKVELEKIVKPMTDKEASAYIEANREVCIGTMKFKSLTVAGEAVVPKEVAEKLAKDYTGNVVRYKSVATIKIEETKIIKPIQVK